MARRSKRALIIGGSIAGLHVARLLARQGWTVQVFEKVAADLRTRGAGIATHPETFAALQAAGIAAGPEIGLVVARRRVFATDGQITHDVPSPQVMAPWASIYRLLRDALQGVELILGAAFVRFDDQGSHVIAHFADGSSAEGDLLIGADGFRSSVRRQCHPQLSPHFGDTIAWRGMVAEDRLSQRTRERLFGEFCFCLPPREQITGYPISGASVGNASPQRAYNFVWYRPVAPEDLHEYLIDANGLRHDVNVPPPLVRPDMVAHMRALAQATLCPEFVDVVTQADEPFYQPIFELDVPSMARGRVALIGDAAFVARPHVGAGVTKALEDGMALADCLRASDIQAGLATFDAERAAIGRRIVERGRELGRVFSGGIPEQHERARVMMLGSATLDFLQSEAA